MLPNTHLRAELDAYYARLYGLTRDELRYTPFGGFFSRKAWYVMSPITPGRVEFPST